MKQRIYKELIHKVILFSVRQAKQYIQSHIQDSFCHKRPVIPFEERIAIVEAIRYVDKVVPQISMDKMEAYNALKFDALFHGSDWKGSNMYEKIVADFEKVGVDVVFLPHTDGISSTISREKVNK